jgi:hypothetical protein
MGQARPWSMGEGPRFAVLVGENEISPMARTWLNASDAPMARGMQRESAASSLPRLCGITTHDLRSA